MNERASGRFGEYENNTSLYVYKPIENHKHSLYPIVMHRKGMMKAVTAKYAITSNGLVAISPMIRYTHNPVVNLL